ncbi:hypothetical protein K469DRAFT_702366 [Zopfia rhizophila CBS 207.26]|uniref:Uncharacterized protein n=1 Tax=Zopfia rhizophila CBS 207.26 TaxID=1314779 RepID=A0A6A6DBK7_9PEZI|nr:hypothetical protein K469DRAFT_702366 [Zopfia rhizophila CBS 207.26]
MSTIHSMLPARNVRGRTYTPHVVRSIPCIVSRMDTPNRVAREACRRANVMGDLERLDRDVNKLQEQIRQAENEHMKYLDLLEEVSRKATEARARVEQLRKQKELMERCRAMGVERARQNLQVAPEFGGRSGTA